MAEPLWHTFDGVGPEWQRAFGLAANAHDLVLLPGGQGSPPQSRFGFVGRPSCTRTLFGRTASERAHADTQIAAAFEPSERWNVVLLPFEWGRHWLLLETAHHADAAPALIAEFDHGMVVDHEKKRYRYFGAVPEDSASRHAHVSHSTPIGLNPLRTHSLGAQPQYTLEAEIDDVTYSARIERAQKHIRAGDIYQANIARPLKLHIHGITPQNTMQQAVRNLRVLAEHSNAAHQAYLKLGHVELLSNSMESLLHYHPHRRQALSFPIKGTRDNAALLAEHPKERAEHMMIVDLVRNDLGKVCKPGSVKVPELMGIYPFPGLYHGISTVTGTLANSCSTFDLVRSLFPGGSITGAPKRKATEIISNIESEQRGYYTGSLALISPAGHISMSILIRTAFRTVSHGAQWSPWRLWVGGGIVADSNSVREIQETWEKVGVFRKIWGDA